ncbi:uncharacterized protein LTR77_007722 [Saxophila tyrrhenica]|uniref:Peptidase C14 caspase domain-containing protein n=1 Tax=Saxophila tyrrhenica TaxID=1690608 RepID=A0AAV9P6X4_9PEZI|nr:hypothetical protein LTR77_007722 [Saxophila tyrrhenica]
MGSKDDNDRDVSGARRAVKGDAGLANPPPPVGKQKKKSLLIGINYVGSKHALAGCQQDVENIHEFLTSQGYPTDQKSQVIMRDDEHTDRNGRFWPTGANILAAMQWLVSEPGTCNFLHYSGHGGQIADTDGNRVSGFDSTIVPYDYESKGQIPSGILHKTLVSHLPPKSTLFMIFDCCHSGSAAELPYIYRADEDGNISMMDNLKAGMRLVGAANNLIQGGFSAAAVPEARNLLAGAQSFFKGMSHQGGEDEDGLAAQDFAEQYEHEKKKNVWMYSGCEDDQTSADATIKGSHVGAMSYAFLETMKKHGPKQSYIDVLANTRAVLQGKYTQVPQLSVGYEQDLNYEIHI